MVAQLKALEPGGSMPAPEGVIESRANPFARLRAVHDEAQETSRLANLLGRTFYAGFLLPVMAVAAIALADPPLLRGISFAVLVFMGAGALFFAHTRTIRTPFARMNLREFAADLDAILLYAGFAWGAGAFLLLPVGADPTLAVLFSGCASALVAIVLMAREPVLMFAAPAGLLTALAAYLRPLSVPSVSAVLALLACGAVAGAVALSTWLKERSTETPATVIDQA